MKISYSDMGQSGDLSFFNYRKGQRETLVSLTKHKHIQI